MARKEMVKREWVEGIFPDIYIIGQEGSAESGEQAILIDKDGSTYLIFTSGADYGSWVGNRYTLTPKGRDKVINWEGSSYDLLEWLEESEEALEWEKIMKENQ